MATARAYVGELYDGDELAAIFVRADPNGLAYDRTSNALFAADGKSGALIRIDGERETTIASIESAGIVTANRLGGLAATPYGALYAARLGYGRAGAIFEIDPDGAMRQLPGLSPRFWRLGVEYDAYTHSLYSTQFLKSTSGPFEGSIVQIDLASGRVSPVIDGFLKPVGVVKLGPTLIVTDSRLRGVYRVELVEGRAFSRTLLVPGTIVGRPDSLCVCDPYSVLLTSHDEATKQGTVWQVWLDGRTRAIASGPWEPRGVTTDGERVFVAARRAGRVLVFRL
jgi:sugar lactone lactonase YvrE